jgi:hypothetical protein
MKPPWLAVLLIALLSAADPRAELVGVWIGDSICTDARPACTTEKAAYHIAIADGASDLISMTMNKIVDGKEEEMGVVDYHVDAAARTLTAEFERNGLHGVWRFSWTGTRMRGTLSLLPSNVVVRNITLQKR